MAESIREKFKREKLTEMYKAYDGFEYEAASEHVVCTKTASKDPIKDYIRLSEGYDDVVEVLNEIMSYYDIDPHENGAYLKETEALDRIIRGLDKVAPLVDKRYKAIREKAGLFVQQPTNMELKKLFALDMQVLRKVERTSIAKIAIENMKIYFDEMLFGMFPSEKCPPGLFHEFDSVNEHLTLPIFSHEPAGSDISEDKRRDSEFYRALAHYVSEHPLRVFEMFKDCNNNMVVVKLWDSSKEHYVGIAVDKKKTFDRFVKDDECRALWPELIHVGLIGMHKDPMKTDLNEVLTCIAGSKIKVDIDKYREPYDVSAENDSVMLRISHDYYKCLSDISEGLFWTRNIRKEEPESFLDLYNAAQIAVGEAFYNFASDLEPIKNSLAYLKVRSEKYKKSCQNTESITAGRMRVLDAIDQLYDIYQNEYTRYDPISVFIPPTGKDLKDI